MPNFFEAIQLNSEIGQKQPNLELIRDRRETGESQGGEGRIIRIMVAPLPLHQVTTKHLNPTIQSRPKKTSLFNIQSWPNITQHFHFHHFVI